MGKPLKILFGCAGVIAAIAVAALVAFWYCSGPADSSGSEVIFVINKGDGVTDIAGRLKGRGLVRSSYAFVYYAVSGGHARSFMPGEYTVSASMSPSKIASVLSVKPPDELVRVTIPEGWPSARIAAELDEKGLCGTDEFMSIVRDPAANGLRLSDSGVVNLEGFLFPDTYDFKPDAGCDAIAKRMVRRFTEKFTPEMYEMAKAAGLDLKSAVTLASLVEKEAERADERRHISGVIHNRMRIGMMLQIDATYKYKDGVWDPDVPRGGAGSDPRYDTYQITGLPPGPICNPGEAALRAAVDPDTLTKDLYYVTKEDGTGGHYFSETADGHNANINTSHANMRARGGR